MADQHTGFINEPLHQFHAAIVSDHDYEGTRGSWVLPVKSPYPYIPTVFRKTEDELYHAF